MERLNYKSATFLIDFLKENTSDIVSDQIGKRYKIGKEGEIPKIISDYSNRSDFANSFKHEHPDLSIKDIGAIWRIRNNDITKKHIEVFKFDSEKKNRWHFVGNDIDYNFIVDFNKKYYNIHAPIKALETIKYKDYIYKPVGFRNNKGAIEKISYESQPTLLLDLIKNALIIISQ